MTGVTASLQQSLFLQGRPRRLGLAECDPAFSEVVGRDLNRHSITGNDPNKILPHFSRDVGQDDMVVWQLDPEHCSGKHVQHNAFADD